MRFLGFFALLSAAALSPTVQAQSQGAGYIFVVPGATSAASRFQAFPYAATPLTPSVDRSGPQGVGRVIAKADGSKFYFIGSGASGIQSLDSTFTTFSSVNGLPAAASAVAITPDGRYLLIGSSDLYVVDTVSNAILGTGLGLSGTVQSIAWTPMPPIYAPSRRKIPKPSSVSCASHRARSRAIHSSVSSMIKCEDRAHGMNSSSDVRDRFTAPKRAGASDNV